VALATVVTAAAAALPGMSQPRRRKGIPENGGPEAGGEKEPGRTEESGRTEDTAKTLKSARVRTAGELREFIQDLPQDTRILFSNIERGRNPTEGMDIQVKHILTGTDGRLCEGTGRNAPPTTPEGENSRRAPVLLLG
jgi:hypothetical protein